MQVFYFKSTMTGAPVDSGAAGTRIAVWDALLVNGFNSRTLTSITRSSSTATATFTAHGYEDDQIIQISGAVETEYNGKFRIFNTTANTFDYTVTGSPATPATGTITSIVAPVGWTKPYSSTNIAVYKSPAGTQERYYRVDDTTAAYCQMIGYETMSAHSTGTGLFPTAAQLAAGVFVGKSTTGVARPYEVVCNGATIHHRMDRTGAGIGWLHGFGDILTRKSGDLYCSFVNGSGTNAYTADSNSNTHACHSTSTQAGCYLARSYTQLGTSTTFFKEIDTSLHSNTAIMGAGGTLAFPDVVGGALADSVIKVFEANSAQWRGWMPGMYASLHTTVPLTHGDKFVGTGAYSSKTFIAWAVGVGGSGMVFVEVSDTW